MAITVKHTKVSTVADDADTSLVRPSDWNADHALTGLGTMAEQNSSNVNITGGSISGTTVSGYIPTSEKGANNGVATLDAGGKVPTSQIPLQGDLNYQGTWNATTNSPTLTSSVGTKGYYYVVDVAGSTNLNGITDWKIGDWAIFNGSIWEKVDNTDAVTSVNGQIGTVVLTTTNIAEGTNEYFTTTRARQSISAGTGISYDNGTGVVTNAAPDQTVGLTAGTGISVTGTYPNFTIANTSPSTGGDVVGPASATDNAITRFDQTTGKLIQNSTVTLDDNGNIINANSLGLDTTPATVPTTVGTMSWDDGDGVPQVLLKGGNTTLQVGTQEYARVYNDSGTTLTKGQAVYISGAQGNRVAVRLARADVEATSFGTIGLVAESIANGAEGFIVVSGALYKLDTTGLTAGATVYLSPTTAGAVTTTKPQAPDQLVVIGWVERVDNIVGSIYVKVDNGYELDELHDVRITSPQSGNVLIYDASTSPTGVWKNANLTDGTGITITEGAGSVTIANSGVTALSAGTGISVSGSTGSVTVTNTAPDQTVSLTAGTGISVTGTYPSFTVTNTSPSTGGDVTGPASSTDNAIARFDQTTGKIIQNSVVTVSDTGEFTGVSTLNAANIIIADNATLGSTTADSIAFNGRIVTGIEPDATNSYDIGSSGKTWRSAFIGTTLNTVNLAVTGTVSFDADQGTAGQVLTSAGSGNTPTWTTPATGTVTSVSGTAPIASSGGNTPAISITQATGSTDGYLSSTDWNTFNNKQPAGTYVTSVGATSPITSTGGTTPTIAIPAANGSTNGYLTSTDWTTFNSKGNGTVTSVATGTGLTGGPITGTGTISLANTAVTPASYTYASITVDAQGRLTAASSGTAPVTSVSGTAPIASSGGTTPAISIPKATGSVDGYLSSTDWTTFNNKGNGTVTSVTGTSPVASSGGATPAISLSSGYGDTQNPYASKTANNFLAAPNGSAGVPTFRAIVAADIPTLNQNTTGTAANVTGTVAIANGGTGQTTAAAAFNALNPMTTTGDIIYEDSAGVAARLGIGSSGQVLTVSAGKPAWGAAASSNITTNGLWENAATISANYTIGTNNNAVSAGPITVSTGVTVTVPTGSTWTVV